MQCIPTDYWCYDLDCLFVCSTWNCEIIYPAKNFKIISTWVVHWNIVLWNFANFKNVNWVFWSSEQQMHRFCFSLYDVDGHRQGLPNKFVPQNLQRVVVAMSVRNVTKRLPGRQLCCNMRTTNMEGAPIRYAANCVQKVSGTNVTCEVIWPVNIAVRRTSNVRFVAENILTRLILKFTHAVVTDWLTNIKTFIKKTF